MTLNPIPKQVCLAILGALILMMGVMSAWANPVSRDHIEVELVSEKLAIAPDTPLRVGLRFLPDPQWHTYWTNPGDSGLALDLEWTVPEGTQVSDVIWPYPQRIEVGHLVNYGFEGEHLLPLIITPPSGLQVGDRFQVSVEASWLVCKIECIPGQANLTLDLPVETAPTPLNESAQSLFQWADQRAPERQEQKATFNIESGLLRVRVPVPPDAFDESPDSLQVLVTATNLVDHAQPVVLTQSQNALEWTQPLSPFFAGTDGPWDVVLVNLATERAYAWPARADGWVVTPDEGLGRDRPYAWVLVLALLGGLILNLMPCVFPVLSIKALALVQVDDNQHRRQALAYTLGVVASFVVLAALLMVLRAGGEALGWGFQLQTPWVVGLLAYVFFMMGLSFSGAFDFAGRWMGLGQSLTTGGGWWGSFMSGVLAAVVASPCTAPLMGTALGVAVLLPWTMAIGVFASLGLGLAMPLLILGFVPTLSQRLPKPGPWMNTFKEAMAFPLYLATVWLVWVLAKQTDAQAVGAVLLGMVVLAFSVWLSQKPERHGRWSGIRHTVIALGLLGALVALAHTQRPSAQPTGDEVYWQPYSPERLQSIRTDPERAAFVNMTAAWCVTCLVNEQVALSTDAFRQALIDHNVVYLKGDWTRRDATITAYLAEYGRNGVPLYVAYPKNGGEPVVLPQILTPQGVVDVLDNL